MTLLNNLTTTKDKLYTTDVNEAAKYVCSPALRDEADLEAMWQGLNNGTLSAIVSHIDSVPNGGIYDGCLGVLGAIECIREMNRCNFKNIHPIEVVAFIEEEGNAVGGTFGSKCFTGMPILPEELEKAKCFNISSSDILAAKRNKNDYCAYVELHIEQGGILENETKDIGIVEGIVGIARFHAEICGDANHAGTTPMVLRNDAMQKSAVALSDLYQRVSLRDDGSIQKGTQILYDVLCTLSLDE